MGDHESDGLEYQDDEEEEDEDDESVHDLTGGGALLSVQLPVATAVPRLHNAPRECAICMPRGNAGRSTDFRDQKSRDFSGEIFLERNYCPRTGLSGSNPRKILSHPVMS